MYQKFQSLTKEERLYIVASIFFFAGFAPETFSDSDMWLLTNVMDLSEDEIKEFKVPDYESMMSHIRENDDKDIQNWIITNTYKYVLRSNRNDARLAFQTFVDDLNWNQNLIRESIEICEDLNS